MNVKTEKVKAPSRTGGYISARGWGDLGAGDILRSIEIATGALRDCISREDSDELSALATIHRLLNLSGVLQDMAMNVLEGLIERKAEV